MIEDSEVLRVRIECTLDKDKIFGYTIEQKIQRFKNLKVNFTHEFENSMYPSDEREKLKKLLKDIDTYLDTLNG